MPSKTKHKELEEQRPDAVILQLTGSFYNAYGDSALALSMVTGYMLKDTKGGGNKCGFPVTAKEKVIERLRETKVNYSFHENEAFGTEENFGPDNRFKEMRDKRSLKLEEEKAKAAEIQQVMSAQAAIPAATQASSQHIAFIQGHGMSIEDAMVSVKQKVEEAYIGRGRRVVSISLAESVQSGIHTVQGLLIYEDSS